MARERGNNCSNSIPIIISSVGGSALIIESKNQIENGNYTAGALMFCTGALAHLFCLKLLIDMQKNITRSRSESRSR